MTSDTIGGVWTYTLELCRALAPHGVRIELATMGAALTAVQRRQVQQLTNVCLHESSYRLEWMADPWEDLDRAAKWLLQLERATRPAIVHLNHLVHAELPWRAPVLSVGHSCVLSWWQATHGERAPATWDTYAERVRSSLRAATCIVAPSAAMLSELQRLYGPLPQALVIHNCRSAPGHSSLQRERVVLCAGRVWDRAKNVETLARAALQISAPVMLAGESHGPDGHGLTFPNLSQLGQLDEGTLNQWYARAAIYVLPARYEPFGLTALEAALAGCALVLGDIPSLREIWGSAAEYVSPNDADQLGRSVNRLLTDDGARCRAVLRASAQARAYRPEKQARQYHDLYRALLDERLAGARRHGARAGGARFDGAPGQYMRG
ncbi:MAG: glycosyltransferase [Sinobacteraceae bacterium]|nr:glycosyltransferase [Nevskiaceae bacterium]